MSTIVLERRRAARLCDRSTSKPRWKDLTARLPRPLFRVDAAEAPRLSVSGRFATYRLSPRAQALILAAVLVVAGGPVPRSGSTPSPVGTFLDDAYYIVNARGIATGAGFALISYPGNPPETK